MLFLSIFTIWGMPGIPLFSSSSRRLSCPSPFTSAIPSTVLYQAQDRQCGAKPSMVLQIPFCLCFSSTSWTSRIPCSSWILVPSARSWALLAWPDPSWGESPFRISLFRCHEHERSTVMAWFCWHTFWLISKQDELHPLSFLINNNFIWNLRTKW